MAAKLLHMIPDDLHQRVKVLAKKKGMTVTGLINKLLTDFVDEKETAIEELQRRVRTLELAMEELKKCREE